MIHNFHSDFAASNARTPRDRQLLAQHYGVPTERIIKTVQTTDEYGIDFLVPLSNLTTIGVDMKNRSAGSARYWPHRVPEVIVELSSGQRPGPLFRVTAPAADYLGLTYDDFPQRIDILPLVGLAKAARVNRQEWIDTYGVKETSTRTDEGCYTTRFVPVPLPVIVAAMQQAC